MDGPTYVNRMSNSPQFESERIQPLIALTPLYNFTCDDDDLQLNNVFRIRKHTEGLLPHPLKDGDPCLAQLEAYPPEFLLWQVPEVSPLTFHEMLSDESSTENQIETISSLVFLPAARLFHQLRLFKSGRLFAGDTFVLPNPQLIPSVSWGTIADQRASMMRIDYSLLRHLEESYSLSISEIPFLQGFIATLSPILESLLTMDSPYPQLDMALELFGRADGIDSDVLNSFTALEGLLTNDSTSELSYRLSARIASLLGEDDESRKRVFKEMKSFYDLRSKIIHGSGFRLKPKHQAMLEEVPRLRELVRRVLLRIMALLVNGVKHSQIEDLLDNMVFDENARKEIYSESTNFIHIAAESAKPIV